jgi:hypothetical protein
MDKRIILLLQGHQNVFIIRHSPTQNPIEQRLVDLEIISQILFGHFQLLVLSLEECYLLFQLRKFALVNQVALPLR